MKSPRKIITRSPHRRTGLIACPWLQPQAIGYESLLECHFVRIALLCPGIITIKHQPLRLDLGKLGTYTPDFLLTCGPYEKYLIEVKPTVFLENSQTRLEAARNKAKLQGCEFLVCTDEEIYKNNRHERAGQILRQARSLYPKAAENSLLRRLETVEFPIPISLLIERTYMTNEQIMYLIGRRFLYLSRSLETDLIFKMTGKEHRDGNLSPRAWLSYSA